MRKNCSSDREKLLKFEAEGREFANFLRSLEQFIQTVKGQNNFGNTIIFSSLNYDCSIFSRNKLKNHSVTKNCSDLSLFE